MEVGQEYVGEDGQWYYYTEKDVKQMKMKNAIEDIKELGHIFAVALAERGHDIDDKSDLINGIAAYELLSLKGESKELDNAMESVVNLAWKMALEEIDQC